MGSTKENRWVPVGRSPGLGQGAAGAQGAHGTLGVVRKLPFPAQRPRGALQPLCLEPMISAPASASILPFLGDFSQSALHQCPFMQRLTVGNQSMLWCVFRFRAVLGKGLIRGKGKGTYSLDWYLLDVGALLWEDVRTRLRLTGAPGKGKMISFNINGYFLLQCSTSWKIF